MSMRRFLQGVIIGLIVGLIVNIIVDRIDREQVDWYGPMMLEDW